MSEVSWLSFTLLTSTTMSGRSNRRDPKEEERIRRTKELIREGRRDPSYRVQRDQELMREKQRERELERAREEESRRLGTVSRGVRFDDDLPPPPPDSYDVSSGVASSGITPLKAAEEPMDPLAVEEGNIDIRAAVAGTTTSIQAFLVGIYL